MLIEISRSIQRTGTYWGMVWESSLFIDTTLPFGLRSAPKIFTTVADAAEWIARQQGVTTILHYLDDFLVIGHPGSAECMARDVPTVVSSGQYRPPFRKNSHHSDKIATTTNLLTSTKISTRMKMLSLNYQLVYTTHTYVHT